MSNTIVMWFRQDLRLSDLPALQAAARDADRVVALYVLDEAAGHTWRPGAASRWWLHHSLDALAAGIAEDGGALLLKRGASESVLQDVCAAHQASRVYCSRRYEPWAAAEERDLHAALGAKQIELRRFPGALLHEPGTVLTQGGEPFKVFTPFWRACQREDLAQPLTATKVPWAAGNRGDTLESLSLLPRNPNWAEGWTDLWTPGERGARERARNFLAGAVDNYAQHRDRPAVDGTSRLSPHLHHGEISPRQLWALAEEYRAHHGASPDVGKFQAELGWREFSYHLMHFFPDIPETAFKANFSDFPWQPDAAQLKAWQQGMTGYPIVDAGMRELWHTGYMHNRVRMVVASFLCKHLLQHWRKGAEWFWDTLLDADLASNSCSWQWVAGSGADAAPYFRIFNPVTQGEKFDKEGAYVRRWVPEIAALPDKFLHKPWEAPADLCRDCGVKLGETYPHPIVDHREARERALNAYEAIKLSNTPAP